MTHQLVISKAYQYVCSIGAKAIARQTHTLDTQLQLNVLQRKTSVDWKLVVSLTLID